MTTFTIARAVGIALSKTREQTTPLHTAYHKADKEAQAQLRYDWTVGFIAGNLGIEQDKATTIAETKRTERSAKHQAAVYRSNSQFTYHVIRPEGAGDAKQMTKKAKLRVYAAQMVKLGFDYADMTDAIKVAMKASNKAE